MVYIMPEADPKQTAKVLWSLWREDWCQDKLGQVGRGEMLEGDGVRVDGASE